MSTVAPHDPEAVAAWQKCSCEFCVESLTERGLPLKATTPDETPEPAKPTSEARNDTIRRVYAAGGSTAELADEYKLSQERIRQICKGVKQRVQEPIEE